MNHAPGYQAGFLLEKTPMAMAPKKEKPESTTTVEPNPALAAYRERLQSFMAAKPERDGKDRADE